MPPNRTFAQQIGLSASNLLRWYLPVCLGSAGFLWATSPDGPLGGGEKPRTLSDSACIWNCSCSQRGLTLWLSLLPPTDWAEAQVMRTAYMPREASPTPVPHNPFRHNRAAADLVLAGSKARWPKEAAARDSAGRPRAPLTESKAEAAARAPLNPSEYTGAEPEKEARVEAVAGPLGTRAADAQPTAPPSE